MDANEYGALTEEMRQAYQNYNPRRDALAEARALLTLAAEKAMAAGALPAAELPAFIVEIPADVKNGDAAPASSTCVCPPPGSPAWCTAPP